MVTPYIGVIPGKEDCRVPEDAILMSSKYCENCERVFFRPDGSKRKFCTRCCQAMLLPVDDTIYREALPVIPNKPNHLIHYDDSFFPERRTCRSLGNWAEKLMNAFMQLGPLSTKQMQEITGHKNRNAMLNIVRAKKIPLAVVGHVWPANPSGPRACLFNLEIIENLVR